MNIDEYIKNAVENLDFDNFLERQKDNIYLRKNEIDILKKYNISYELCSNLSEIIYKIEEYLSDGYENDELEWLSRELSERNYYQNTNK